MKISAAFLFLVQFWLCMSCSKTTKDSEQVQDPAGTPVGVPSAVVKSFATWWNYNTTHIKLYEDFTAYDTSSIKISKDIFMRELQSGAYIPIKYIGKDSATHYKLYKLPAGIRDDIEPGVRGWMNQEFSNYQLEGKPLKGFNYVDLDGKIYNRETTKDKIVVLKCWFIGCKPCIEEMPELNKLVAKYKDRKDMVFVSLAFDSKEKLRDFLKKKQFDYAVVADRENYIINDLNIKAAPTHLIINKKGMVTKVVNSVDVLIPLVDKEAALVM